MSRLILRIFNELFSYLVTLISFVGRATLQKPFNTRHRYLKNFLQCKTTLQPIEVAAQ